MAIEKLAVASAKLILIPKLNIQIIHCSTECRYVVVVAGLFFTAQVYNAHSIELTMLLAQSTFNRLMFNLI